MDDDHGTIPPPDGVEPDFENPKDVLNTVMYVTQTLTIFFVSIFVALRIYAKKWILKSASTGDDWATYISYILMVGYCTTGIVGAAYGAGFNQWEVSSKNVRKFSQAFYAATIFYAPMAMTVKLALLLIIIRVFGVVHTKAIIGIKLFLVAVVLYYVTGLFLKIFVCNPISAYWDGPRTKCLDQRAIITVDAIISVISDLVILLLPTPLTWSLRLSKRKRLRIVGMLCAGGIATGFSIFRLVLIIKKNQSPNETIVITQVGLSGNAEVGIGLICACLPALNAVLGKVKKSSWCSSSNGSANPEPRRMEIVMTRSVHVDTTSVASSKPRRSMDEGTLFGYARAGSVANVQANAPSEMDHHRVWPSRIPESTDESAGTS